MSTHHAPNVTSPPPGASAGESRICGATHNDGQGVHVCAMPADHVARGQQHVGQGLAWDVAPGAGAGREEPAASPLSATAAAMIGALTGCAAMVQAIEGDSPTISEALHEWATAKSDLSRYVASLESSELAASADRDELQQDRSDVWRTLGIAQDATADTAIAAIVGLRSALAAERAAGAAAVERLHWLAMNPDRIYQQNAVHPGWNYEGFHDEEEGWADNVTNRWYRDLNEAIDAARALAADRDA